MAVQVHNGEQGQQSQRQRAEQRRLEQEQKRLKELLMEQQQQHQRSPSRIKQMPNYKYRHPANSSRREKTIYHYRPHQNRGKVSHVSTDPPRNHQRPVRGHNRQVNLQEVHPRLDRTIPQVTEDHHFPPAQHQSLPKGQVRRPEYFPPNFKMPTKPSPQSQVVLKAETKGDKVFQLVKVPEFAMAGATTAGTTLVEKVLTKGGEVISHDFVEWWKGDGDDVNGNNANGSNQTVATATDNKVQKAGNQQHQASKNTGHQYLPPPIPGPQYQTPEPNVGAGDDLIFPRRFRISPCISVSWFDGLTTWREDFLVFSSWNKTTERIVLTFVAQKALVDGHKQLDWHLSKVDGELWRNMESEVSGGESCLLFIDV